MLSHSSNMRCNSLLKRNLGIISARDTRILFIPSSRFYSTQIGICLLLCSLLFTYLIILVLCLLPNLSQTMPFEMKLPNQGEIFFNDYSQITASTSYECNILYTKYIQVYLYYTYILHMYYTLLNMLQQKTTKHFNLQSLKPHLYAICFQTTNLWIVFILHGIVSPLVRLQNTPVVVG